MPMYLPMTMSYCFSDYEPLRAWMDGTRPNTLPLHRRRCHAHLSVFVAPSVPLHPHQLTFRRGILFYLPDRHPGPVIALCWARPTYKTVVPPVIISTAVSRRIFLLLPHQLRSRPSAPVFLTTRPRQYSRLYSVPVPPEHVAPSNSAFDVLPAIPSIFIVTMFVTTGGSMANNVNGLTQRHPSVSLASRLMPFCVIYPSHHSFFSRNWCHPASPSAARLPSAAPLLT